MLDTFALQVHVGCSVGFGFFFLSICLRFIDKHLEALKSDLGPYFITVVVQK